MGGTDRDSFRLELLGVEHDPPAAGVQTVRLVTNAGTIDARLHPPAVRPGRGAAVLWVGGVRGGLDGPAGGLYPRLAAQLAAGGIASLRVDYRRPTDLTGCVLDALVGVAYLENVGHSRIALVGHSLGGAVVITAGAISRRVVGVAALSSQTAGTELAGDLAPRPLLLLHGSADIVLSDRCSAEIYRRAAEPRRIIVYPGCGHGLDECREQVERDLSAWLHDLFATAPDS